MTVLSIAACGDSGGTTPDAPLGIDSPRVDAVTPDAAIDAPAADALPPDAFVGDGGQLVCPMRDAGAGTLRPVDLLFMVDDSSSMTTSQNNLVQNFPVLITSLTQALGQLPDLHIAIITSDMGAGAFTSSVPGCMTPDLGNFITTPRAPSDPTLCTNSHLNAGEHFIKVSQSGTQNNFTGNLTNVFSCLAQVGANGCGVEHQFAAVRAALGDPSMNLSAPAGNAGFLRDGALLAIVLLTNEDDCSLPPNSELFDPNQNSNSDPLGPLASFRCTEFGILCNGQPVPRQAGGPYQNCVSNDARAQSDPLHSLIPAPFFIDYLRRVKANPCDVVVASVDAPTDPFAVVIDQQTGFAALQHSCSSSNGTFGDPAVRIHQILGAQGTHGLTSDICQNSYASVMQSIANLIATAP